MKVYIVLLVLYITLICDNIYAININTHNTILHSTEPTSITFPSSSSSSLYISRMRKKPEFVGEDYGDLIDSIRTRIYHTDRDDPNSRSQINKLRKMARRIDHDLLRQERSANETFHHATDDFIHLSESLNALLVKENNWLTWAYNLTRQNALKIVNITNFITKIAPVKLAKEKKTYAKLLAKLNKAKQRRASTRSRFLYRATHIRDTLSGVNNVIHQLGATMAQRNVHYNDTLKTTLNKHYSNPQIPPTQPLPDDVDFQHMPDHLDGLRALQSALHSQLHDFLKSITNSEILATSRQTQAVERLAEQVEASKKLIQSLTVAQNQGKLDIKHLKANTTAIHSEYPKHVNIRHKAKKKLKKIAKNHQPIIELYNKHNIHRQKQRALIAQTLKIIRDRWEGNHWRKTQHPSNVAS